MSLLAAIREAAVNCHTLSEIYLEAEGIAREWRNDRRSRREMTHRIADAILRYAR